MADIAILCPLQIEYTAVLKILSNPIKFDGLGSNIYSQKGQVRTLNNEWNTVLVLADKEVSSIGSLTTKVAKTLNPKYLFLVGVAGGIKDVQIGDLLIATLAYEYEHGKETPNGFVSRPRTERFDQALLSIARQVKADYEQAKTPFRVEFGPIASGKKVISSTKSKTYEQIKKMFNDTKGVEMEAYDFAHTAAIEGCKCLNIRGISDLIDDKKEAEEKGSQLLAANRAAEFAYRLIEQLPTKTEIDKFPKSIKVNLINKPFSSFQFRTYSKGILRIAVDKIHCELVDEMLDLGRLKEVEYIRMPGDFAKNWIIVSYQDEERIKKIYLSAASTTGLGNVFGGSKKLFAMLDRLCHRKRIESLFDQ